MSNVLSVENLNYKNILKNINFTLEKATINALMGSSGSGKTTILKSIFGLIEIEGFLNINGLMCKLSKRTINGTDILINVL